MSLSPYALIALAHGGRCAPMQQYTGKMRPGRQSPTRQIPKGILLPDYAKDGRPKGGGPLLPWQIEVKDEQDIAGMRAAGRIAREVLDMAGRMVAPGVATDAIDAAVHEETIARNAYPSPLNYHGFPKSCCTSVNEVRCTRRAHYMLVAVDIVGSQCLTFGSLRVPPARSHSPLTVLTTARYIPRTAGDLPWDPRQLRA